MAIERRFPNRPTDVIYIAISFVQKWSVLIQEKDKAKVQDTEKRITA